MLRPLRWNAGTLGALGPRDSSERWLPALIQSHTLRGVDAPPGSPPARMERLYTLTEELAQLEVALRRAEAPLRLVYALPPHAVLWVPAFWLLSFWFALLQDSFEERLLAFAGAWAALAAGAVALIAWNNWAEWQLRREQRGAARQAQERREQVWAALRHEREALAATPWVVRSGERLVVHCPDLDWLEQRLLAQPEDPALEAALEALRSALDQHLASPPERWSAEGLRVDREALTADPARRTPG